jgi:hypothetical protein
MDKVASVSPANLHSTTFLRVTGDETSGFISECWNQRAVKAVDAQTFTKQIEKD